MTQAPQRGINTAANLPPKPVRDSLSLHREAGCSLLKKATIKNSEMKYLETYKTRDNEASIPLKLGDVSVTIPFKNGNVRKNEWATYTTADPLVQLVIEKSNLYGRSILLDSKQPIVEEEVKKARMKAADVTNIQQLRDYLVEEYHIDRQKVSSPNAMKARVTELGIELPNMVW
jgi:hypothetical protein